MRSIPLRLARWSLWSAVAFLLLSGPVVAEEGAAAVAAAHLSRDDQGRYDLEGRQQSLSTVLAALAELEGFELIAPGLPHEPIQRDYRDIGAEGLIERLTEGMIVATEYASGKPPRRLKKVVVYPNTGAPELPARAQPRRPPGASDADEAQVRSVLIGDQGVSSARQGIAQLAQNDTPESARLLATALESEQAEIRRAAIVGLAGMKNEQAVELLAQVLFSHEDAEERLLAAQHLKRHPNPNALALLSAAAEDADPRIKALAAEAQAAEAQ